MPFANTKAGGDDVRPSGRFRSRLFINEYIGRGQSFAFIRREVSRTTSNHLTTTIVVHLNFALVIIIIHLNFALLPQVSSGGDH